MHGKGVMRIIHDNYMKNHFTSRIIFKDREIWFNTYSLLNPMERLTDTTRNHQNDCILIMLKCHVPSASHPSRASRAFPFIPIQSLSFFHVPVIFRPLIITFRTVTIFLLFPRFTSLLFEINTSLLLLLLIDVSFYS